MKSFYDATTGRFLRLHYEGPDEYLDLNTPDGALAIDGRYDADTQAVDLSTGAVVSREPGPIEPAEAWRLIRHERNRRLSDTDWIVSRSSERGEEVPVAWREYRQALRDITLQADPLAVAWPQPPED